MNLNQAARCLEKLGNPTRLEIYRLLVRAGPEGLAVGALQKHLEVPASTLSHHLAHLVQVDLLRQEREGRVLRCTANYRLMEQVVGFLNDECCRGVEVPRGKRKAG